MSAVISAAAVRDLREKSGAGMLDCKKALEETGGDLEAAMDKLRAKGLAKAAKKSDRAAAEGAVAVAVSADGLHGALIELNSETDFVARNDKFQEAAGKLAVVALQVNGDLEQLLNLTLEGVPVREYVTALAAVVGENVQLRRAAGLSVSSGSIGAYVHNQIAPGIGKIAVLTALKTSAAGTGDFAKQIAMHAAASAPIAMSAEQIDPAVVARESAVLAEKAAASGKPAAIIEKIVESGLKSYYKDVCLPQQAFVLEPGKTVAEAVAAKGKELGAEMVLEGFVAFRLGEGVEKVQTDFAAEVAAAAAAS